MGRGRFLGVGAAAAALLFFVFLYRSRQVAHDGRMRFQPNFESSQFNSKRMSASRLVHVADNTESGASAEYNSGSGAGDADQNSKPVKERPLPKEKGNDENTNETKNYLKQQEMSHDQDSAKSHDNHMTNDDVRRNTSEASPVEDVTFTYEEILQEEQDIVEADRRELDITQLKHDEIAAKLKKDREMFQLEISDAHNSSQQQLEKMKREFEAERRAEELQLYSERQELIAERRRLEEDKHRFEEQMRQLKELSQATEKDRVPSTKAPRFPPEFWEGLVWEEVHSRFPGILFLSDYKLRNFFGENKSDFQTAHRELSSLLLSQAEDRFYNLVTLNHVACLQLQRMGNSGDGGWDVCVAQPYKPVPNNCIVYSFGINNDFSFDDDIASKFGCQVYCFDPSMSVGDHLHAPDVYFYQLGLGASNSVNDAGWKLLTMTNIMAKLGHTDSVIDILKIDIEFNEWKCFQTMLSSGAMRNVKQLVFEIHTSEVYLVARPSTKAEYYEMYSTLYKLEQLGFRRFHYHFNPFGKFTSINTGKQRTCCYELYYININFLKPEERSSL